MKLPRFLSTRLTSALAVGCALMAFAAAPSAQAQIKIVALNDAAFDKLSKFVNTVTADPAAKAAMDETDKETSITQTVMSGGSINDAINTKYPKAAAIYKNGGYTPDEFYAVAFSLAMAGTGATDGTSDPAVAKANIEYYNANKDKIDKLMASMK